jgi:hypothetical protein
MSRTSSGKSGNFLGICTRTVLEIHKLPCGDAVGGLYHEEVISGGAEGAEQGARAGRGVCDDALGAILLPHQKERGARPPLPAQN